MGKFSALRNPQPVVALRLRIYLKSLRPAWLEIVDAADWLRGDPAAREDALARVPAFFGRYLLD